MKRINFIVTTLAAVPMFAFSKNEIVNYHENRQMI